MNKLPSINLISRNFWLKGLKGLRGPLLATALLSTTASALAQTVYSPNDWYTSGNTIATGITNGGTTSPTVNYHPSGSPNASNTYLWSYFAPNHAPAQLGDGMTLTFSASLSIDFTSAASRPVVMRLGIFDSSLLRASTEEGTDVVNFGETRLLSPSSNSDPRRGWTGFITETVSSGGGTLYRRNPDDANGPFATVGSGVTSASMEKGIPTITFFDNVPVQLTIDLKRIGDDLFISGSFGEEQFYGEYLNAFVDGYPDTFDTFGLFLGGQGTGGITTTSLSITNASVTLIPEPSTMALAGGSLTLLLALGSRKGRNA